MINPARQIFLDHLSELSTLVGRNAVPVTLSKDERMLEPGSAAEMLLAITGLQKYVGVLQSAEIENVDFTNSLTMTTAALKELRLSLPKDALNRIMPTDHVEIYTDNMVPAFKSVNFWGSSSYALDEIYSLPYDQLFGRDEFYQAAVNRAAEKIFSGALAFLENPVPEHLAWEIRGPMKRMIKYKFFSAVYDPEGQLVGCLVSCQVKLLEN